ncbi:hypothetical protein P0136_11790 [Lentisphaerota bacterium ZTH]|nr:hypothetical protein JYG24_10695 [Lentisphaerota bacterium]WET06038.1 hypothetical protein P0136_11790 [Lentisphaerota bacterium ZTH]
MQVNVIEVKASNEMEPLTCRRMLHQIPVAGIPIKERLMWMFEFEGINQQRKLDIRADLWPSSDIIEKLLESRENIVIKGNNGVEYAKLTCTDSKSYTDIELDENSIILRYPWDILALNEIIVGSITEDNIQGTVRERVTVDGTVWVGKNSTLLPGVYIEGNVVIGENCKIGPNCYIRGNTYIGDNCHIGQAVEIKNSMIMHHVAAGHLSYVGDSIICPHANLGAGTIGANLRHDNKNHKSIVNRKAVDTGRRKFGFVLGDNVHTGIHTSIYPGRKMWPDTTTTPGETLARDKTK